MPKQVPPLTDTRIRLAQASEKPVTIFDGDGLFLLVQPNGAKWWRFKYRFGDKTKTLSFGVYPDVSLKLAREKRGEARDLLVKGIDPSLDRKEQKQVKEAASKTFQSVFNEWLEVQASKLAPKTVEKIRNSMTNHALPKIGALPIRSITLANILEMLKAIEATGALEMATRVRAWTKRVFRYAVQTGLCQANPAQDLHGVLKTPKVKHHAALAAGDLPVFWRTLEDPLARLQPLTRMALKLLVLTATRPGELRGAEWAEFDEEKWEWRIPAARMKMKEEHVVPLSRQALAVLQRLKPFSGDEKFLFPAQGNHDRTLSENTLGKAARALGFAVTAHGFRSTFSTYANESEKWSSDAIEAQLAHKSPDAVRGAYYRGSRRLEERRRLMQWWADELDRMAKKKG